MLTGANSAFHPGQVYAFVLVEGQILLRHVLVVLSHFLPSAEINVIRPLRFLEQKQEITVEVMLEEVVTPAHVAAADVIVACRNMEPIHQPIFEFAASLGVPWLYDLDDNLWEVPDEEAHSAYYHHPARLEMLSWLLQHAHKVRVHSRQLRELVLPHNPNVRLVWAAVDLSLVPRTLPSLPEDCFHIVYATSRRGGDPLLEHMRSDLVELLETSKTPIKLHIMGAEPGNLRRYPQLVFHPYTDDYRTWFSEFTHFGYAIGLAPIRNDSFHNCKTDTKFRDYAAAGAAGIYEESPVYQDGVIDGVTGLLISGQRGTWLNAIQRLTGNPELLQSIRQNAAQVLPVRNSLEQAADAWMEDIDAAPAHPLVPVDVQMPVWKFTVEQNHWTLRMRSWLRQRLPPRLRVQLRNLILDWQLRHRRHR